MQKKKGKEKKRKKIKKNHHNSPMLLSLAKLLNFFVSGVHLIFLA